MALVEHLYRTTAEHADLIVGTIGDTLPGYAAGKLNSRGFPKDGSYVTPRIAIPKSLRRTGQPFKPLHRPIPGLAVVDPWVVGSTSMSWHPGPIHFQAPVFKHRCPSTHGPPSLKERPEPSSALR